MPDDPIKRRILAAREEQVTVAGRTFTVRRLGDVSHSQLRLRYKADGYQYAIELVRASVIDWDMDEQTLFPGGSDARVPFSTDVFMAWVDDHGDTFAALFRAAEDAVIRYQEQVKEARKN